MPRFNNSAIANRFRPLFILVALSVLPLASAEPPARKLSRSETSKLVDQYVDAVKARDFEAWRELLIPLHADSPLLTPTNFLEDASMIKSLSIEQIDGLNADLKIKHVDGRQRISTLQIHPSGHIKYTPLLFKHPVSQAYALVKTLLNDRLTLLGATTSEASRYETIWNLDALGIPQCGYDPSNPLPSERRAAAQNILQWLEENGLTFDNTEPRLPLYPGELARCIEDTRSVLQ